MAALQHAEKTSLASAIPLRVFAAVFRPFIALVNGTSNAMLRSAGLKPEHGFESSHTAEEIQHAFDGITLAAIYGVLAYYLRHRAELDDYLAERARVAEEIWRELEARQGPSPLQQRLLAQRQEATKQ